MLLWELEIHHYLRLQFSYINLEVFNHWRRT
jgi:hypothetical protein